MGPGTTASDDAGRHHRRSREEVEALAKNFAATPVEEAPPPAKPRVQLALAAAGVALAAVLAVVLWPSNKQVARPEQAEGARAVAEAEQWRQRFEAERERKRQEMKAGSDYMAKVAAADSALQQEVAGRAAQLTAEPEAPAEPAPKASRPTSPEPTPKEAEPTPRKAPQAAAASVPAAPQPAAVQPAVAETAAPVPAEKSAPTEPATPVASTPSCRQHVSQLTSSGTLTYAEVSRMKGVRTDSRGHVFTPPVTLDDGRRVIFEVMPDGCMKWRRA